MIVAAELELAQGVELPPGQLRSELDLSRSKNIRRSRHDRGRSAQAAARRHHVDAGARTPFDRGHRVAKLNRQAGCKLGQQRAETLAAESIDVPFGRAGEIKRRNLRQILTAAERAEEELDRRAPLA